MPQASLKTSSGAGAARDGRARLLSAALYVFVSRGFDGASIRDIGDAAGMTNPALYRHFAGKDELGASLYRDCYRRMMNAIEAGTGGAVQPLAKIEAAVHALYRLIESDLRTFLFIDENQTRFWPLIKREFGARSLSQVISSWIKDGRRDGSIDADAPLAVQLSMTMGCLSEWAALRAAKLAPARAGLALPGAVRKCLQARRAM